MEGDSTIEERLRIEYERRAAIDSQLEELALTCDFIDYKCWYYDVESESGTCEIPGTCPSTSFRKK